MLKKIITTSLTTLVLVSCVTSPLGRKQLNFMPADQMNTMGIEAFSQMKQENPIETNRQINNYVTCIANALIQVSDNKTEWEVVVFKDETANAFALPGGKIGVHTGLLNIAENQHQLAAVVGHEIGHVLANHSNERVSQEFVLSQGLTLIKSVSNTQSEMGQQVMGLLGIGAQYGIILPYSRTHESEADEMGLYFMAKAGFDPTESVKLWQNMGAGNESQPPEFSSTHPSHDTRIANLNRAMGQAKHLYKQVVNKPNCNL
ncbi:M48 family metallopeptidase [Candidatus Halobeggiatoa sp. HSG11]|nr:M48 family metallopeptidase [Candidatus Halobeggiatoa sp. HSG11]